MKHLWQRIRAWGVPPALRIRKEEADPLVEALCGFAELLKTPAAPRPPDVSPPVLAPAMTEKKVETSVDQVAFVVELCNVYFRIRRNLNELQTKAESAETRKMKRSLDALEQFFGGHAIRCVDLEGQPWDDGRMDMDLLAAEDSTLHTVPTIGRCERPAIHWQGRLLQKAKGVVLRPAGAAAKAGI